MLDEKALKTMLGRPKINNIWKKSHSQRVQGMYPSFMQPSKMQNNEAENQVWEKRKATPGRIVK